MPLETSPRRARHLTATALLVALALPSADLFGMSAEAGAGQRLSHAKPPRNAKQHLAPERPVAQDDSMSVFVRTHLALQALRDRVQAELAEPRNKKDEEQKALRDKLRTERVRILKEHAMTEEQFARMTRWVSVNDSARKVFDALVAKAAARGA